MDSDPASARRALRRHALLGALGTFFRRSPLSLAGAALLIVVILASLLAPFLTPYSPTGVDIQIKLAPPTLEHPLGTDQFGRDVLSRILHGGRNTLTIGLLVIAIAFVVGVPIGIFSGFVGGRVDALLMRVVDAWLSFPTLVLAIAFAAALGPSLRNAMIAVAITFIPQFVRVARAQALGLRSAQFVEAAAALGARDWRLMSRHVFLNGIGPLLVQASLNLGSAILQTASLGFLGLGAQPPLPEWGADVAANTRFLRETPWVALFPGLAILLSVMALNLISDGLVDWLNPRARSAQSRRRGGP